MAASGTHFGLTGLAVMGANLARNVARHDIPIAVHNRTTSKTERFMAEHGGEGPIIGTGSVGEFVDALEQPRTIMVMVKAGAAVDAVIEELVPHLDRGDAIVDGGNSNFRDTQRRTQALADQGLRFLGVGVSGGEEGALEGPSIMPGGDRAAYADIEHVFTTIAAQVDGTPCCTYVGPDGAGHYVKMVHNGIEYADIQLIAEAYDLLRHGVGLKVPEVAAVFEEWDKGDLDSFLIESPASSWARPTRPPAGLWSTSSSTTGLGLAIVKKIVDDTAEPYTSGRPPIGAPRSSSRSPWSPPAPAGWFPCRRSPLRRRAPTRRLRQQRAGTDRRAHSRSPARASGYRSGEWWNGPMRAVVQRVTRARVRVGADTMGEIGLGLLALIGVTHGDGPVEAERMAGKLANLRVFGDEAGVMNRSVLDVGGGVLVVSQFTLYGDTSGSRRPSWAAAAPRVHAEPLVEAVVAGLRKYALHVASGRFGADMEVELVNAGPVTVIVEVTG